MLKAIVYFINVLTNLVVDQHGTNPYNYGTCRPSI